MKKSANIRYFLLIIFFVFNSFSVSTSNKDVGYVDTNATIGLNADVPLEAYPEALTKDVSEKLDSVFMRFNKRYDFHGSVIIAKKGKVVFKNQYGYADFKKKTRIDDQSVFQLASVSKQFTATTSQVHSATQQISSGAPFGRVGIGNWEIAALKQHSNLV